MKIRITDIPDRSETFHIEFDTEAQELGPAFEEAGYILLAISEGRGSNEDDARRSAAAKISLARLRESFFDPSTSGRPPGGVYPSGPESRPGE